jgi:phosphoribosylglycinamide formyltransferase 1
LKSLAIFASGGGSNALRIIEYFEGHEQIHVTCIITNNASAGVVTIADFYDIPSITITHRQLNSPEFMLEVLAIYKIDYMILAGFLLLIPAYLIDAYPDKIINIHPALLPKYGGKGMYGINVHRAVVAAKDHQSGATIHLINEEYDKGRILQQMTCDLDGSESAEEVAAKVLELEHQNYAPAIEKYVLANG